MGTTSTLTERPPWLDALHDHDLPCAVVDLDAFDANLARLRAAGVELRVATKSVRSVDLLQRIAATGPTTWMVYSAKEAELLALRGFEDLLLAYPVSRRPEARRLAAAAGHTEVRVVVDDAEQLPLLDQVAAERGVTLGIVIDVDASWRIAGRIHVGVRRSPVRHPGQVVALARSVSAHARLRFDGIMCYEAQIAGLRDHEPTAAWQDPARQWLRRASRPRVEALRSAVVAALRDAGLPPRLVNGGGTGSWDWSVADPSLTERTAGSALFCPHLFDGSGFTPAAFFVLPVTRRSDPGWCTASGGGFVASGSVGPERWPVVAWPPGTHPSSTEGWGEVQTPFRCDDLVPDLIVARHAKAGELCERFDRLVLVRGAEVVGDAKTTRGEGWACP